MRIKKTTKQVYNSTWISLLKHGFSPVKTWLLIPRDTAFYAIIFVWSFKISLTVFMSSTDMILSQNCFLQVQRGITKNTYSRVMVVVLCTSSYDAYGNSCINFYEHILNGFKVVERTWFCHRNCFLQSSKGRNSNSINTRTMVFALCMSSNVG